MHNLVECKIQYPVFLMQLNITNFISLFPLRIFIEACPLGAYCPAAKLNKSTGVCEP